MQKLFSLKHQFFLILIATAIAFNLNLNAQENQLEKLEITYKSDFQTYPSHPVYCLEDFYTDSQGKIWLSTCLLSNLSSSGLLSFDGYKFVKANSNNSVLNKIEKNYIGISNDRIYGYSTLNDTGYLYYYDINKNGFEIYDTINIKNLDFKYDDLNDEFLKPSIFQKLTDGKVYTYLQTKDALQLYIYDDYSLEKKEFSPVELNKSDHPIVGNSNANKEWYFYIEDETFNIISQNLKTGKKHFTKTVLDQKKTYLDWNDNFLTVGFQKSKEINVVIYKTKDNSDHTFDLLESYSSFEEKTVFVDDLGQYIFYKKIQGKKKMFLVTSEGETLNISAIGEVLNSNNIKAIKGNNFTKELKILTNRGFYVIKLGSENVIQKVVTNSAVRGLDLIDQDHLIYLEETEGYKIRTINIKSGKKLQTSMSCDFQSFVLLRHDSKIWGIVNNNLTSYDPRTGECLTYKTDQKVAVFKFDNSGNVIFKDSENKFWIYNLKRESIKALNTNLLKQYPYYGFIDFVVDEKDFLWIVSPLGLIKYDLNRNTFENITDKISGFNYSLTTIALGKDNELWLGSFDSGLILFDKETCDFKSINTKNFLPNNTIASITKDNNGYFWVGTYKGVAVFDNNANLKTTLFESDGLVNNECNRFSAKLLNDGRLAIGTIDGISLIDTDRIISALEEEKKSRIYYNSISYYNADEELIKIEGSLNTRRKIILPPDQNNISIEFATSNYIDPLKNIYSYKIEGLHQDWIDSGKANNLYLQNLPSGNHIIKIRGSDSIGNQTKNTLEIPIKVETFFYNEIWFYIVLILLILAVSLFIIWLLNSKIKRATLKIKADKEKIQLQSEKLKNIDQAKSEFFTNITHEFRTPITIIRGISQILRDKYDKESDKELNTLDKSSNQLLDIVNQILDLRKLESNKLEINLQQSDLIMFIGYIIDSHQYLAKQKDIELVYDISTEQLLMDFDIEKLRIALTNLISNAIKFTQNGGKVFIDVIYNNDLDNVRLIIQDNGKGFSSNEQKMAFELFYQSNDNLFNLQKGSGIGLYYAKKMIELMHGKIVIESVKDQGTTITISLPVTNNAENVETKNELFHASDLSPVNETPNTSYPKKEYKVLIVEDNKSIRDLLQLQLTSDYELYFAENGKDGVNKAKTLFPDLIISDVMMPEKDGFELCKSIKEDIQTSHIPVILLTAKVDKASKIKGLKCKVDHYLVKPFDFEELKLIIKNSIERRKELQKYYKTLDRKELKTDFPVEDNFILQFRSIVLKNMTNNDFKISDICDELDISRAGLHNKIKILTNLSTSNYINYVKIHKAKELLESEYNNIAEVSYNVGIQDPNYFSRLFKKEFGLSPKEFRDNNIISQ